MTTTTKGLVVLATTGALALAGCGSTSSSSSTTSAASTASASASAGGNRTDAQLAAILKQVKTASGTLDVASTSDLATLRKGLSSSTLSQVMEKATVTPEACKTATLRGTKDFAAASTAPLAAAMDGDSRMVVIYDLATIDAARTIVDNNKGTGAACPTYTVALSQAGQKVTVKGTTKVLDIQAASTQDATGQLSTTSIGGQNTSTSSALGTVGDVLVQVADPNGKATAAQLSQELEAVAKAVAAAR